MKIGNKHFVTFEVFNYKLNDIKLITINVDEIHTFTQNCDGALYVVFGNDKECRIHSDSLKQFEREDKLNILLDE